MAELVKQVPTWRKVLAAVLDFVTIFFVAGYVIGYSTGGLTTEGFKLDGMPALILFAVIVVYFVIGGKYLAARFGNASSARGDIAARASFATRLPAARAGDLSYFNKSFRRLYGATPSDVRAKARHDDEKS